MINVVKHGRTHKRMECEECGCIFECDKVDIKVYYEDGLVQKIRCPECGSVLIIETEDK